MNWMKYCYCSHFGVRCVGTRVWMRMSDEGMSVSWMRRRKTASRRRRRRLTADCSGGQSSPCHPMRRSWSCRKYCRAGEVKTAPPDEPSRRKRRKRKHCVGTSCVGEYCVRMPTRTSAQVHLEVHCWAPTERSQAVAAASRPGGRDIATTASRVRRQRMQHGGRQRAMICLPATAVRWENSSWPPH